MGKAFLPDFGSARKVAHFGSCCSVSIIFGISIQRGIFLLMIRRESITSLTVSHCIVTGCVVHSSIELFSVNEFGFDVFVTVSADNTSFCCS